MQVEKDRTKCRTFFSYLSWRYVNPSGAPRQLPFQGSLVLASPFRGKYLEEGMGAPGVDMEQGLTLL